MNNEQLTPSGWHWKITPEQIEKIKARDRDTVTTVYFDNLDKFKRMAKRYCACVHRKDYVQDCLQQVYIDLPEYNYADIGVLHFSIKRSFRQACCLPSLGVPLQNILSLNTPLYGDDSDDDVKTLADFITTADTVAVERKRRADECHALDMIAAQTQLTENERDVLTAIAFGCAAYEGVFAYAFKQAFTA